MSTAASLVPPSLPPPPRGVRKRKPSFSSPSRTQPPTTRAMSRTSTSLRRSESYLSLSELFTGSTCTGDLLSAFPPVPYAPPQAYVPRSLQPGNVQRLRTMAVPCPDHRGRAKPPPAPLLSRPSCARSTSPLAPTPHSTTPRPTFPRSKPDQNLYRAAIAGCMRATPHGKKILNMGARLAISILTATQELERIVAAQRDVPSDGDKPLSSSWVVLPDDDWEMVDASAPSREVIRAVAVV